MYFQNLTCLQKIPKVLINGADAENKGYLHAVPAKETAKKVD